MTGADKFAAYFKRIREGLNLHMKISLTLSEYQKTAFEKRATGVGPW